MLRHLHIFCSVALLVGNSFTVANPLARSDDDQRVLPPLLGEHGVVHETGGQSASLNAGGDNQRPFYAIAHRVLTTQGVEDALKDGANAIEIDMTAWKDGWYADHDGTATSAGDTAETMFKAVARAREAGRTVNFVWLDIKNPDYCDPSDQNWRHCSVDALRDLARDILQPRGVRVLYGFYDSESRAYRSTVKSVNDNEAINLNGKANEVKKQFERNGPSDHARRVMSYGYYNLPFQFDTTLSELNQAARSNAFGKVFGWTSAAGQSWYVDQLLDAGIDGLIYGFKMTYYYDHEDTRAAAQDIMDWLRKHSNTRRLADQNDNPW